VQGSTVGLLRGSGKKLIILDIKDWVENGAILGEVEPPDPSSMVVKCALLTDGQVKK
jgi:hypothetical protein